MKQKISPELKPVLARVLLLARIVKLCPAEGDRAHEAILTKEWIKYIQTVYPATWPVQEFTQEPVICKSCLTMLGECIGGAVLPECPLCPEVSSTHWAFDLPLFKAGVTPDRLKYLLITLAKENPKWMKPNL